MSGVTHIVRHHKEAEVEDTPPKDCYVHPTEVCRAGAASAAISSPGKGITRVCPCQKEIRYPIRAARHWNVKCFAGLRLPTCESMPYARIEEIVS